MSLNVEEGSGTKHNHQKKRGSLFTIPEQGSCHKTFIFWVEILFSKMDWSRCHVTKC